MSNDHRLLPAMAGMLLLGAFSHHAFSAECQTGYHVVGYPTVIDGDTIAIGSWRIRLQGVAASELDEPGGDVATDEMRALVEDHEVSCVFDGTSTHGRCVATC